MATKKSETKFVPCVARHFTARTVSYGKMVNDKFNTLREQIADYDGTQIAEIAEALAAIEKLQGPLQEQVLVLARLMDARSSQPQGF